MKKNCSANKTKITPVMKRARKLELRQCHPVFGFNAYLTSEGAAHRLRCSTRRVRQLLQAGRLMGAKLGKDWVVKFPFTLQVGQRGPKANLFLYSHLSSVKTVGLNASK